KGRVRHRLQVAVKRFKTTTISFFFVQDKAGRRTRRTTKPRPPGAPPAPPVPFEPGPDNPVLGTPAHSEDERFGFVDRFLPTISAVLAGMNSIYLPQANLQFVLAQVHDTQVYNQEFPDVVGLADFDPITAKRD